MDESSLGQDLWQFFCCLARYFRYRLTASFRWFERGKSGVAAGLYRQRGRFVRPFIHSGMALLIIGGITLGPVLISETFSGLGGDPWQDSTYGGPSTVLSAATSVEMETATLVSIKPRAETVDYEVQPGDTISSIAEKFGVSIDTIRWANNLSSIKAIKTGQTLEILPVSGIVHKVSHGETVYSVAKKYSVDAQAIVNWPYNSYANDETFALAAGQELIIPDGIMPKAQPTQPRPDYYAYTPQAGSVTGTGAFAWPASGRITQGFRWYHQGIDIANKASTNNLAADGGTVIFAGWRSGYGQTVIIDHGNGFSTLYGHFNQIYVNAGQAVSQGQPLGLMGATGRATGIHLHFEIRKNGVAQDPMAYLK